VGYEFQLFGEIPAEPHDIRMDMVITQSATFIVDKNNK
jgi:5-formyltetrahydrofolate cyclo-ligase